MIYLSIFILLSSAFFFIKGMREGSKSDRDIAIILLIVGLFTGFWGMFAFSIITEAGYVA